MKIQTYLPIFSGFYNTIFEPNEEQVIEDGYSYKDYKFDYKGYRNKVAKACCNSVEDKLKELGFDCKITFEEIKSPREYNFTNDSINITIDINKPIIKTLYKFIMNNYVEFGQYIRDNFTSYSGFHSFYSNDALEWSKNKGNLTFDDAVVCSNILEFVLLQNDYNEEEMCDYCTYHDCNLEGELLSEIV